MQRQVDGYAPALAAEPVDHVPPQVAAGGQAMDEQRPAAGAAGVDMAGRTRLSAHLAAVLIEALHLGGHEFLCFCVGCCAASSTMSGTLGTGVWPPLLSR